MQEEKNNALPEEKENDIIYTVKKINLSYNDQKFPPSLLDPLNFPYIFYYFPNSVDEYSFELFNSLTNQTIKIMSNIHKAFKNLCEHNNTKQNSFHYECTHHGAPNINYIRYMSNGYFIELQSINNDTVVIKKHLLTIQEKNLMKIDLIEEVQINASCSRCPIVANLNKQLHERHTQIQQSRDNSSFYFMNDNTLNSLKKQLNPHPKPPTLHIYYTNNIIILCDQKRTNIFHIKTFKLVDFFNNFIIREQNFEELLKYNICFLFGLNSILIYNTLSQSIIETININNIKDYDQYKNPEISVSDGLISCNYFSYIITKDIIKEEDQCCVCFKYTNKEYALIPCGHTQYCNTCINNIIDCAICRTPKTMFIKIFL